MSLILIPGASGSGKSHMLFQRVLREAKEHPDRRYIVLVPEQNTLQTQKTLVSMSERGGIWNIDVLSFTRLAYRVFEQTGVARRQILSETGKILLLRLIAAREGAKIPLLSGVLDRPGILGEIKSILSEMDQYGIGPDELKVMLDMLQRENTKPALSRKLSEIALLQEACERYQEGHFITGEKLLRVLGEKIPLDETLKGTVLCLDGFTGLTPAQLQVITVLLKVAQDIYVTVTIDPEEIGERDLSVRRETGPDGQEILKPEVSSDYGLYALSKRTIHALVYCAVKAQTGVDLLSVPENTPGRHAKDGELWWLEKHILRSGREGKQPFPGNAERHEIFLRQCANPWDEAVSAAVTIEELIREGVRYREIAIVCGSLKDYAEYIRRAMSVYGIPCYIDRSSTVVMNPAFEFVRCAIDVMEKNFSYESIMALLRTGLALDPESGEIDLLENYILAAGIRGYGMWSRPFTRKTRERNQALQDAAELSRTAFMEKYTPFAEVLKKRRAQVSEYAGALWKLLLAFDLPAKLDALSRACAKEGREERAQEYAAVLRVICNVLDEAVSLMPQEGVTRTQFAEILRAGFSEAKIGILPRGIDEVQVGDLERSRMEKIKVLLFLGLNDEYVPRRKMAGGVLTDYEREYLSDREIHLAPTAREEALIQQFYLYLTLARPSQALYLSWSCAKRSSEEMRPSSVVRSIRALFPAAEWARAASADTFGSITSLRTGKGVLSQALGDYLYGNRMTDGADETKLQELINLYRRRDETWRQNAEAFLSSLSGEEKPADLDEDTATALYGMVLQGSITRLERFSECAFKHFADYGLELKEREEYSVRSIDIGVLLHRAVEIFSQKLRKDKTLSGWRGITDDDRDRVARESLAEALDGEQDRDLFLDSRRSEETLERCERIFLRSVQTLQRQIRAGAFEPVRFELSFGGGNQNSVWIENLPGGRKLSLSGKIDRIDECEQGAESLYIKIVDYKSSTKDIDLESLIEGEQLQLLVYLDAAARLEQKANPQKEIICAGAFYFSFQDPVIDMTPQMTDGEAEDAAARSMRVRGLVNERPDVVERLDAALADGEASLVIPASKTKTSGHLSASNNVVTDEQFRLLRDYSKQRMRDIASAILEGKILPNPSWKNAQKSACTWCPYRDLCRFDPRGKGMAYRERVKRKPDEQWELIKSEVGYAGINQ